MDYECDAGYMRDDSSQQCVKVQGTDSYNHLDFQKDVQAAQCETQSFYEISQGYRKVPGNRCVGGLDLAPKQVSCSYLSGWFSLGNMITYLAIAFLGYFVY